jgi:hypothetical protein
VNSLAHIPPLLADRSEMLRDLGSAFRGERAKLNLYDVALVVFCIVGVIVVFWLLARFAAWREGRAGYHNPKQLFRRLAAAHRLSLRERQLLNRAARHAKIPLSTSLFLRPDLFDMAASHSQLAAHSEQLSAIRRKLFGKR